ncbi:DUF1846 family protein [Candidatus Woesearchaeota archaeon]|nr:DUF1846 family protein [Candidatus Woesearchaeota archaeon]
MAQQQGSSLTGAITKQGFSSRRYFDEQVKAILDRVAHFDKLYLEFGGKILTDYHAARVLPGYEKDLKVQLLKELKDESEILYCVGAKELQKGKIRHDLGLTHDTLAIKEIQALREQGLTVTAVVITRFEGESAASRFKRRLENLRERVYVTGEIKGYPRELDAVTSERGFGKQPRIETTKPLVIVTGAAAGAGKCATCLAQFYLDNQVGVDAGYAKLETFPIWNLPLKHPVNLAYEAAAADLQDRNLVDRFHQEAYGKEAVNYNRDVENFEILDAILKRTTTSDNFVSTYRSPTDMGVNRAKEGIVDDGVVREASKQEVVRRYFSYRQKFFRGIESLETLRRMDEIMQELGLTPAYRRVVVAARRKRKEKQAHAAAVELADGRLVTGKSSSLLHAEAAVVLNALKTLAGVPDDLKLLPKHIIGTIQGLRTEQFGLSHASLDLEETLITLAIASAHNPLAQRCVSLLRELNGCEMHATILPTPGDDGALRKLRINVTADVELPVDGKG